MRPSTTSIAATLSVAALVFLFARDAAACQCPTDTSCSAASCDDDIEPAKDRFGVRLDLWRVAPAIDGLASSGAGSFGLGTSMHARFGERAAMELGFDLGYGTTTAGLQQYTMSFRFPDVLIFLNPHSTTQLYLRTGITHAIVALDQGTSTIAMPSQSAFYYLGGVVGLGVQHFVSKDNAVSVELRGTARARIDSSDTDYATTNPDFHAATRIDKGVSLMVGWLAF
ncbi:MAG: hypothetical protein ACHREM_19605 [Polyangiales bacterium]